MVVGLDSVELIGDRTRLLVTAEDPTGNVPSCPSDAAMLDLLVSKPTMAIDGDTLTLTGPTGSITLRAASSS